MAGIRNVKDYSLDNLSLLTPIGVYDVRLLMNELSYQEDLYTSTVHGYLMLTESGSWAELFNLTGNEFIRFTLNKDGNSQNGKLGEVIDKTFRVYKMDKRKLSGNMYTEAYYLYFCSEEMLLSEQYKVSKAYTNQNISSIVYDVCTSFLGISENKLNIDPTYGVYNFVIPNLKPFDAINWLSTYARPMAPVPGADMVFFENKNGFNFSSLQNLMDGPNVVRYDKYTYDPKNTSTRDLQEQALNVTTYEIMSSYDALGAINSGVFANQLISVDILTRNRKVTKFDYLDYWNNQPSLGANPYPITNNYKNRFGDQMNQTSESVLKLIFTNYDDANNPTVQANPNSVAPNIFAETYVPYRTAQLPLANYTRVRLSVPGDPNLTVGYVIDFQLLSKNPSPDQKKPDAFYSGFYLITAVRHLITQNEYKTVMEVAKDSVQTQYADINTNSTLNQSVVKQ